MTLQIKCPGCSKALKIGDQYRGKRVKCPACKKVLAVGGAPQASPEKKPASSGTPAAVTPPSSGDAAASEKLTVHCVCGATLRAPASARGKQVQCPKCGQRVAVSDGPRFQESLPPGGIATSDGAGSADESPFVDDPFVEDPFVSGANADDPFAALPAATGGEDLWSNLPAAAPATNAFPAATNAFHATNPPAAAPAAPAANKLSGEQAALAAAGGYSESLEDRMGKAAVDSTKDTEDGFAVDKFHIALVAMIFIGPVMAFFSYKDKIRYDDLVANGVKVDGVVTDGWERRGRRFRRSYYLEVEYQTPSGVALIDDYSVGSTFYHAVDIGDSVTIAFDENDPEDSILLGGSSNPMTTVLLGIGITLFGVLGAAWVIYSNFMGGDSTA